MDLKKAFLQIEIKEEYRDAFPFLFNINGREEHLRFARVPFGAEARLFMLGATLQHHFNKQSQAYEEMIESLEENTYMDNLMKTGSDIRELSRFKEEAIEILQNAKFPVHKWESDVQQLDKEPNQSKILGLMWDKRKDTLEIQVKMSENSSVTKWSIQSQLSAIYDPLGVILPTIVEGERIYRDGCDEKTGWRSHRRWESFRDIVQPIRTSQT